MANLGPFFFWRPEDMRGPLRRARDLIPDLPDEISGFIAGLSAPPATVRAARAPRNTRFRDRPGELRLPEEHAELVTPIPHVALQQLFDESAPGGF